MFPIRDINPSKTVPWANYTIIGVNILVFMLQLSKGPDLAKFVYYYGIVPARYSVPEISLYFTPGHQIFSFISFMFLHGGFLHIAGNMWMLYIFGDNVEDYLGPFRYVVFYFLCGIFSGAVHLLTNIHSNIPVIGASGAIAGVMGAYLLLYPGARILTLIPIFIFPLFIEIPAYFFLGFWFLLQFLNAAGAIHGASEIAWWAHVGGFLSGMIFLKMLGKVPETGITKATRRFSEKKKTHRLQVIKSTGNPEDSNLYGTISVSPFEAMNGTTKVVNIPWGFHNRLFKVHIPPGTTDGSIILLEGLGKKREDGTIGDVILTVKIDSP